MEQDYQIRPFGYRIIKKKLFFWSLILFFGSFISIKAQNCVVNAGVLNETICAIDAMTLIGNTPSPIIGTVSWTQISGPSVIITSPNSTTTTVTGYTGGNTYVFRYSATCGDGIVTYQDKTVIVEPITIANAGTNIASCPNSSGSITVTGNQPENSGETGHWEITGANNAGVVINFPTSATTTLTLPTTSCGVSTLTWVIEGPDYAPGQNCSSSSSITVTNYGGVTPVTAGSDITLSNCYTTTQNVNLNGSFGGCGLNGQNGTWTFVSGPNTPTIANANSNTTNISNLQEGTYVMRWSVAGPCVSGTDEVSITVPAATQDVTTLTGGTEYTYFCDNTVTQVTLTAQAPLYAGETVLWTQTGGSTSPLPNIQSPTNPTTLITGISDAGDPYTFRYTLTNSVTGCISTKDYVVEYKATDRTILANNGENIFGDCDQTDFTIPITVTGTGANKYRFLTGPDGSPLGPFPTTAVSVGNSLNVSLTEPGTYILQFVRSETGDLPVGCDYGFDSLTIVVSANATPSNAGSDVNLDCGVTVAPLSGVGIVGAGNHYWTQISGPNTALITDRLEQNTTATGLTSGTYEFQYITKGGGTKCPLSIDNVTVYVSDSTLSIADAGTDTTTCVNSQLTLNANVPSAGEYGLWSQIPDPANPADDDVLVFSDTSDPHATVTGFTTLGTVNRVQWTIGYVHPGTGGCSAPVSDFIDITTSGGIAPAVADAGPDACYPITTTSINLAASNPSINSNGAWTVSPSTGAAIVDVSDPLTAVTITANGTYTFTWTITPILGSCGTSSDNVVITIAENAIVADAGGDQNLCDDEATMTAVLPAGTTGLWTRISGLENYTISDPTDPHAIFTFTSSGPYVFRWTITSGSCSATSAFDEVKIIIGLPPSPATAGVDQVVCGTTTQMAGSSYDPFFEVGEWSLLAGAPNIPVIVDATNPATVINNLVEGTYVFRWKVESRGNFICPGATYDDVTVEVAAPANAGSDQTYCNVTSVQLIGTLNSKGTWTCTAVSAGNIGDVVITQTPADSYVANAVVVPGRTYEFTYTIDAHNTCPASSDSVQIIVNSGSSAPPDAGDDFTICRDDNSTIVLDGNTPPVDVDTAEWRWILRPSGSVANITDINNPISPVTNLTVPGLYILEWVFINASCSNLSDIVRINVSQAPSTANAGADDTVACQQSYITNAVAPTVGIGKWTFASQPAGGNAVIDSPNNPKTTLSNITVLGTYVLNWTVTNGTFTNPSLCAPSVDQVSVTFNDTPPTIANAGPDQQLCAATQTNLAAVAVTQGKGTWTQTSGTPANIASPNSPTTLVFGLTTGIYQFTWTATTVNEDGCSSSDTMQIQIFAQPVNANAGPDQTLPEFSPVIMAASTPTVGQGEWVRISGPTSAVVFASRTSATTAVSGLSVGTTVFEWRVTNGPCTAATDRVNITIVAQTDLELTKSVTPTNVNIGDEVTFTINVFNNNAAGGTVNATGVGVKDLLPNGYTLVSGSVSNGGVYNVGDASITWSNLNIALGATLSLTFKAKINATGTYVNSAEISACDQIDIDSTPNNNIGSEDDQDDTSVSIESADLSVLKSVAPTSVNVGNNVVFTIAVTNSGPNNATNVSVRDQLPAGYTYVSDSGAGAYNAVTARWTVGSLNNGSTATLNITAAVKASSVTNAYQNTAQVIASDQRDPDSVPNNDDGDQSEDDESAATVTILPDNVDLILTKKVVNDNITPLVGSQISFQVTVKNTSTTTATGVQVKDLLPSGYSYVLFSSTSGNYDETTGIWDVGIVNAGTSEILLLTVNVNPAGGYLNIAEVTSCDQPDIDSTPNNGITTEDDYASVSTTPVTGSANLSLTKTIVGGNTSPGVGSNVSFEIIVSNNGPQDAAGVQVTDLLPSGYTYNISTTSVGTYNSVSGIWNVGGLPNGASESLTINAKVNAAGNYTNIAEVTASNLPDPNSTPNNGVTTEDDYASVVVTPITGSADLSLTKTIVGGNTSPLIGTNVSFEIIVTNSGPQNPTGVQVTDLLPSGYTYNVATTSVGNYDAGTGIWNVGVLPTGQSETLTINAKVNTTGVYTNVAEVTASSLLDPDSTPNNTIATEDDYASVIVTPTTGSADLSLTKIIVGGNTLPLVGAPITFNIVVNNSGPQNATGITVTDLLPNGYTLVSSTVTTGSYNTTTGLWTLGSLITGASETLSVTATVNATGNYTNTAEVTASSLPDPDSTPNNSDVTEDDYASVTITPITSAADLSLTKTIVGGNTSPLVGAPITFNIVINNSGPQNASGIIVSDLLPTGYTYVSSTVTTGSYDNVTGLWTIGSLITGASETLSVTATVNPTGDYTNFAEVTASSLPDPDSAPNNGVTTEDDYSSVTITPITSSADLSLTKTIVGGNTSPLVGSTISFEVVVTNNGPQDTAGVQVTDALPLGYNYISSTTSAGTYVSGTGVWNVGTLTNGQSETLTVTATVRAIGNYLNTAEVTASSLPDPDSTPNNGITTEDDYAAVTITPITAVADLSLTKTIVGGNTSPLLGSQVSFEVIVTNNGPQDLTGVQVTDLLPTGYTYTISTVSAGTYSAGTGIWNIGGLPNGQSQTLTITAVVNTTGNYTNIAEVTASSLPDPDSTPNNADVTEDDYASVIVTPVSGVADLSLTKTIVGGNTTPLVGAPITFNIVINNSGPQNASGVTVNDLLPTGYILVSSTVTTGSYDNVTGLWTVGSLIAGASETLSVTATVNATGNYTNIAEVTASSLPDPDSAPNNGITTEDDYSSVTITPITSSADLSLTKTIVGGNTSPLLGSQVSFEVVVTNNGPQDATGVQVTDVLPTGYTYTISTVSAGTYNTGTGIWNIGGLPNGQSQTLTVNATVNTTGDYTNIAEVTASSLPDPDSTPNNADVTEDDYASVIVTPISGVADLSLIKNIVGGNTTLLVGAPITFNIVINNSGPQDASGITVTDILPTGFTLVSSTVTTGNYNTTTGLWTVGSLITGASETLSVTATVNSTGNYTNIAEVTASSLPDPDSAPNNGITTEDDYSSVTITPITAAADLSLTKTIVGGNTSPLLGSQVSFEVIVTNNGPQDVTGVQVTDLLPTGYTYTISTVSDGTYSAGTGIWNIGGLPNGQSQTLTVNATVNTAGDYTNTAEVTASSLPDPDSTPNNADVMEDDYASVIVTPVSGVADLSLTKTIVGGNTTPLVGASITFNIVVNNSGPQNASGVTVNDLLPTGYILVSSTVTTGSYDNVTGLWTVGSLIAGASETLSVIATVNSTGNYTNIAEVTASSLPDPDSTPNNGITTEDDYSSVTITPITSTADLSLTKTIVGGNTSPLLGSQVSFEVIVTNNGPQDVTGVQVTDLLPSGYTYTIAGTSSGTYDAVTGIWNIGGLPNGQSQTLTITAVVNTTGNYTNIAEVTASSLPDPDSTPNNADVTEDDYASVIVTPVSGVADLSLTKTIVGGNTSPLVGSQVSFSIAVNNSGPQNASGISVTDILPTGFTFVSSNVTTGSYDNTTGLWTVGSLIVGATETLIVTATVNATGNYTNFAEITTSSLPDSDSTPNNGIITEDDYATVTLTPITAVADLSLTKTIVGGNASPLLGSQISFEIVVMNNGTHDTAGVQVTDLLPSGYTYSISSHSAGTYNAVTGVWNIGPLPNGQSETLTVSAIVNTFGNYTNTAEVTASSLPDPDSTPNNGVAAEDDYASVTVTPVSGVADLSLTKIIVGGNTTPLVGAPITFSVVVNNTGPQNASGIVITDLLPTGYTLVSSNVTTGNYDSVTGLWTVGSLIAGASETLTVNATVNTAGNYTNIAEVTASTLPDPDSTPNNGVITEDDYASVSTTPITATADLSLTKIIVGGNTTPLVGAPITFSVVVNNTGPQNASGIAITDLLPTGYRLVSSNVTTGNYDSVTGLWTVGSLIAGASETLTVNATVNATGNYTNIAEVTASTLPDPDSTPNNGITTEDDYASVSTTPITATADLSLTKIIVGGNTSPLLGSQVSFEVVVTNNGPQDTAGVQVTDLLPSGYTYTISTVSAGTYSSVTGIWNVGVLLSGQSETLTVNAAVNATGIYTNIAEVTASSLPDPDSTPNNGIAAEDDYASIIITPVSGIADLSLTKIIVGGNTSPLIGSPVSFEVVVTNNGPQNTAGVQVKDVLPSGYTFTLSTASAGSYNAITGIWNIGVLPNGQSETLVVNAIVNTTGNYTNTAEVFASGLPDSDSTPNNGITSEDDYASVIVTPITSIADLSLTKTIVGGNAAPLIGSQISFEVIVTNNGPKDVSGVRVKDLLPSGYTYTISTTSAGTYNAVTGIWNVGILPNGQSETLTVNATVKTTGNYINIAEITASSLPDPDSTPNNGVTAEDDYASVTVVPSLLYADLELTKLIVGGNTSPAFGTTITFQVNVYNNGPQDATNVKVIDLLPSGYDYVVFSSTAGVYNELTGIWTIGKIANGSSETLLMTVIVNPTGNYLNIAEIFASDLPDPDSTPNNGLIPEDDIGSLPMTPVAQIADLSIQKLIVDDKITPLVGSQITFQVTIKNSGPDIATGVEVKDLVPSGYTYVFYNASSGSYDKITGIWNSGVILPNSSQTLLMNVLVNTPTGTANEYLNVSEIVASNQFDPDSTPNNGITTEDDYSSISVTPIIIKADLSIEKTIIGNQKPNVGDIVSFQVKVKNDGPGNATGVEVKDVLPSGFTYLTHSTTSGNYTFADGKWSLGSILNNSEQTLLVYGRVKPATGTANEYLNIAEITASTLPDPDSTPNNGVTTEDDYVSINVDVQSANLSLDKSVSNVKANVDEVVTFTVQINNAGTAIATGVAIEDLLPIGYSNITNISNGGIYAGFRITWTNLQIPLSGMTLTYQATVDSPVGLKEADYLNTVQITASDQFDPNSTPDNDDGDQSEDDEDSAFIEMPKTDIAIIKTVDATDPVIDALINFTVTADNIGDLKATNVEVQDILPSGYQFVAASATSGTYDAGTGIWKVPSVEVNSVQTLTLQVKVLDHKDYLNTAKLLGLDQLDINSSNNQSSATIEPVCLKINNEFSPNDDGINDVFYIDCIANYPDNTLEVYNRWGKQVYIRKGYKNTWDGTSETKGSLKVLPVGTYFYILDLGDGTPKTSGWLYLKR